MRRLAASLALPWFLLACAGCGSDDDGAAVDAGADGPGVVANLERDLVATELAIDVTARTGVARVQFAAGTPGASLEVGDLTITAVTVGGQAIATERVVDRLDLAVGADPVEVEVAYSYRLHDRNDGAATAGYTLTWPYYCGNLFPCHSLPADGSSFELALTGVPTGQVAVYPATLSEAAAYQLAWAIGPYQRTSLGRTTAGTEVVRWNYPAEDAAAAAGTAHLVAGFDWLERNVGPYRFGTEVGSVSAHWGAGAYGGMEHHPLWHVAVDALTDESTHLHEAAHGWFGDGIRLACWEDFVLSEGAATYYEARLSEEVIGATAGDAAWRGLESELTRMRNQGGAGVAWPASCGAIDVLTIFSRVPYVKGAIFLRALERRIGRKMFDASMRAMYTAHGGAAAGVTDLIEVVMTTAGYDATACANAWLGQRAIPTELTCP